jgi:ABC-type bacteriocin/lantibiotic exporter with double-glycine peptidase domain
MVIVPHNYIKVMWHIYLASIRKFKWPSFASLQNNLQNVIAMIPSYSALKDLTEDLDAHSEKINTDANPVSTAADTSIRFENVGFYYDESDGFELKNLGIDASGEDATGS